MSEFFEYKNVHNVKANILDNGSEIIGLAAKIIETVAKIWPRQECVISRSRRKGPSLHQRANTETGLMTTDINVSIL